LVCHGTRPRGAPKKGVVYLRGDEKGREELAGALPLLPGPFINPGPPPKLATANYQGGLGLG